MMDMIPSLIYVGMVVFTGTLGSYFTYCIDRLGETKPRPNHTKKSTK